MPAHISLILMGLLLGCTLPGSLSSLPQKALSSRLVTPVIACEADLRAPGILKQESAPPEVAAILLPSKRKPPASASGSQYPIVASIPLSKRVPASQIRFSTGKVNGVPVLLVTSGHKPLTKPLTFSALLTNPAVWDHSQLNNILYQLGRSFYDKNAYDFVGLVKVGGKTYLGVRWYSPAASGQNQAAGIVLLLQARGRKLDLILSWNREYWDADTELYRWSGTPVLKRSAKGNLLFVDWDGTWKLLPNGEWRNMGMAKKRP